MSRRSAFFLPGRIVLAAIVASCLEAGPVYAQSASTNEGGMTSVLRSLGFVAPEAGRSADFVKETAPSDPTYLPLGGSRPEPEGKPMTREQIQAEETDLAALRARTQARAGRKPAVVVARSAAGAAVPPKTKKAPEPCRMTCRMDMQKFGQRSSMQ